MQGCTRDATPAHRHRIKHRHRSQHTGAADLHENVGQAGLDALGFIFVGNGPTRRFRSKPQPTPLLVRVHFHNCAVSLIGKIISGPVKLVNRAKNFLDGICQPPSFRRGKAGRGSSLAAVGCRAMAVSGLASVPSSPKISTARLPAGALFIAEFSLSSGRVSIIVLRRGQARPHFLEKRVRGFRIAKLGP